MSNLNFKEGFELCLINSYKIYESACLISENGNFGLACSLNILSAEEAVKASWLKAKSLGHEIPEDNFRKMFSQHTFKHNILQILMDGYDKYMTSINGGLKEREKYIEVVRNMPQEDVPKNIRDAMPRLDELKKLSDKYIETKIKVDDLFKWLQEANNTKNNGLYVGIHQKKQWRTPQNFSAESYEISKKYALETIKMVELLAEIEEEFTNKNS